MAKQKNKKINSGDILSLHSKLFTQKKVILNINNQNYEVLVDEKFSVDKIQQLILEVIEMQKQIKTFDDALSLSNYSIYLIIKYFTNIELAKENDFEKQMRVYKAMLDLGIIEKVLENFDEYELNKINSYIKKVNDNIKKASNNPELMNDLTEVIKQISEIEHAEILVGDDTNATV